MILVCFLLGSLSGLSDSVVLWKTCFTHFRGLEIALASLRPKRRSSATFQIDSLVLEVISTAIIATTIPPIMSTTQCIPRYTILSAVKRIKPMRKLRYLCQRPSSSQRCIVSQIANGKPICKLGIPLVKGSILVNQLLISGVKS